MTAFDELVRRTPLIQQKGLWLKLESLQRTGSFKMRGAARKLDTLSAAERRRGVIAASAGNHGLGVALAGRALDIDVEIIVPKTTPQVKRDGIAALGANIHVVGESYDDAEAATHKRARETGAVFVSAYADPEVIRGNGGSIADEILTQLPEVKRIVCTVGGGGLAGGIADVVVPRGIEVVGVQPEANCAMHRSLLMGRALTSYKASMTIAEGCEGATAEITFKKFEQHAIKIALVSEESILEAMAYAYRDLGLSIEPTAAVAIAGVRTGRVQSDDRTVVVVSGGNVEPEVLDGALRI